ncbi:MAG: hypothetical protein HYS27_22810 [Deltaproteobacteria bacterium]|nr:hypothetical protein [Deltaproteobacteria bacterium]
MDITFKTDNTRELLHDDAALVKKWGPDVARCIRRRLDDLRAAPCLRDVRGLPGAVAQVGDKKLGRFHLAVQGTHSVLFELVDDGTARRAGKLNWAGVTAIRVLGIGARDD